MASTVSLYFNIIERHEAVGFKYPCLETAGGSFISKLCPKLTDEVLDPWSLVPRKVLYESGKRTIHLDWGALGDTRDSIVEFKDNCANDPQFNKRYGTLLPFATPELFGHTTQVELKSLLSRALGEYLLEMFLKQHPNIWLHEDNLAGEIMRGGIIQWFTELYVPSNEGIPEDTWSRKRESSELKNPNGVRYWLIHKAGIHLVRLIMVYGDKAFEYLAENPLHSSDDQLRVMPEYVGRALQKLRG